MENANRPIVKVSMLQMLLAKVAVYNQGKHDQLLNPLFFTLKLASALVARANGKDSVSEGLNAIGDHVGSSRFTLRFLSGVSCLNEMMSGRVVSDKFLQRCNSIKLVLGLMGNLLELPSYVHMVAPKMVAYDGAALGRMSVLCWFACTLIDQMVLIREAQLMKAADYADPARIQNHVISSVATACDSVLAMNWALPEESQFLSQLQLGLVGCISSYVGFARSWPA